MTAIAVIPYRHDCYFIGDLALSRSSAIAAPYPVMPTVGSMGRVVLPGSRGAVSSLCSKLILARGELVLAWAGARAPLKQVVEHLAAREITTKSVLEEAARRTLGVSGHVDLLVLGAARIGESWLPFRLVRGRISWAKPNQPLCGGTGGEALLRACRADSTSGLVGGRPSAREKQAINILAGCSRLIGVEAVTATTLQNNYGGGYQVVSAEGERVEYLPLPTYLFHDAIVEPERTGVGLLSALRYYYFDSQLIVGFADGRKQWTRFIVEKPLQTLSPEQVARLNSQELEFQSDFTCSHVLYEDTGRMFMRLDRGKEKIYIEDREYGFEVAMSPTYMREIVDEIRKCPQGRVDASIYP